MNPNDTLHPGFGIELLDGGHEGTIIHIIEEVSSEGITGRTIPLRGVMARRELFGIDDPVEVIEAMVQLQDTGVPECPETGRTPYTDPYTLLAERETAREDVADHLHKQGSGLEHIQQSAAAAAYTAVHIPINGGECVLDRCRRQARAEAGLPDPEKKCGQETRLTPVALPEAPSVQAFSGGTIDPLTQREARREALLDVLRGREEEMLGYTQHFLHMVSGHDVDHVTPGEATAPPPDAFTPVNELRARFQDPQEQGGS